MPPPIPAAHPALFSSDPPPLPAAAVPKDNAAAPAAADQHALHFLTEVYGHDNMPAVMSGALYAYLERPTLRNARRMLRDYGIAAPLEQLARRQQQQQQQQQQRGGTSSNPSAVTPALFKELLAYDTLHDLIKSNDRVTLWDWFKQMLPADVPSELRNAFLFGTNTFTQQVAQHLQKKAAVHTFTYNAETPEALSVDVALAKRLARLPASSRDTLDLVTDNVVAGLPAGPDGTYGRATLAALAFGFLQILLIQLSRRGLLPATCRRFRIYDGLFMKLDGGTYVARFLRHFLQSLKRNTRLAAEVRQIDLTDPTARVPVRFNALFGAHAEIVESAEDHGLTVHLDGVAYPIVPTTNADGRDGVVYPHTKAVFLQHVRQAIALRRDDDAALRRLSRLNFLRDAFKAELAVRHDAFFLTHDRLAYLYYRLLGGKKGFLLIVRTTPGATPDDPTRLPDVRYEVLL
jgi:hypothetical protein